MKKLFIIIAFCVALPTFAIDLGTLGQTADSLSSIAQSVSSNTNIKQIQDEKKFAKEYLNKQMYLKMHFAMIWQDKNCYDTDKNNTESMYAALLELKHQFSNDNINYKYINQAINLFNKISQAGFEGTPTPEVFENWKIKINDNEYGKVNKDLKMIINVLNVY